MACDLCCGISGRELANLEEGESWTKHLICDVCSGATPMGNKRKFWLKEEYEK